MKIETLDRQTVTDATDPRSDAQLLELFIRQRDPAAFALLMQRHGPYVLGICRRATAQAQDAEDVFQACFLELVRNARTIARGNSVAGWLQTVAVRLAQKARGDPANDKRRREVTCQKPPTVTKKSLGEKCDKSSTKKSPDCPRISVRQ